jgi:predicted secreted acid phosphatase
LWLTRALDFRTTRRLELFDHHAFDEWVERGEAPAIQSSLKLYKEVRDLGFKTFLLTGRSEAHQGVTTENLNRQGFHEWDKLILRYIIYIPRALASDLQTLAAIPKASTSS